MDEVKQAEKERKERFRGRKDAPSIRTAIYILVLIEAASLWIEHQTYIIDVLGRFQ